MTYLLVLPAHTTYIMTYMTHTFANIWLPEHKLVESPTFLRVKTSFLNRLNPGKFDRKFQETRTPMRYDISKKICGVNFSLLRPRGATRSIRVPCFCSLFTQATTAVTICSLFLFPKSLRENPSLGLYATVPSIEFWFLVYAASDSITWETHTSGAQ